VEKKEKKTDKIRETPTTDKEEKSVHISSLAGEQREGSRFPWWRGVQRPNSVEGVLVGGQREGRKTREVYSERQKKNLLGRPQRTDTN